MKKGRIGSVLLSLVMILTLVPESMISVSAEESGYQDGQSYSFTLDVPDTVTIDPTAEWTDFTVQCSDLMLADLGELEVDFFAGSFRSDYSDNEIPFLLGDESHEMPEERLAVKFSGVWEEETVSILQ